MLENKFLVTEIWNTLDAGLSIINPSGIIIDVNNAFCKLFEKGNDSLIDKHYTIIYGPEPPLGLLVNPEELVKNNDRICHFENEVLLWNGKSIYLSLEYKLIKNGYQEPVILGIFKDITKQKKTEIEFNKLKKHGEKVEDELKSKSENLRQLIIRIENIKEEENTKIAREIHDELGQALTAIKISLTSLSKNYSNDKDIVEHLYLVNSTIDETIKSMRKISTRLRPRLLDELGLLPAIQWQLREFQTRTGIRCILTTSDEDIKLESSISTNLFRIFQEALTNISRHSKASNVKISIFYENVGMLTMDIKDNGVGIPKNVSEKSGRLGILGMKERAQILGGGLEVISCENEGTEVIVNIPINKV